jgi:hypothetical protein
MEHMEHSPGVKKPALRAQGRVGAHMADVLRICDLSHGLAVNTARQQ